MTVVRAFAADDLAPYIGRPHCVRTHDCADLAMEVAAGLFGHAVAIPNGRPRPHRPRAQALALGHALGDLADEVNQPQTGDLVLMVDSGMARAGHVGIFFFLAHEGHVLHSSQAIGSSRLHRIRELARFGLRVEGYYRWK